MIRCCFVREHDIGGGFSGVGSPPFHSLAGRSLAQAVTAYSFSGDAPRNVPPHERVEAERRQSSGKLVHEAAPPLWERICCSPKRPPIRAPLDSLLSVSSIRPLLIDPTLLLLAAFCGAASHLLCHWLLWPPPLSLPGKPTLFAGIFCSSARDKSTGQTCKALS